LEKNLDPESQEFFSKVRYIITKQERKIFLNLPSPERENFIEEFWKKRDPDPYTEENEFKEQYFGRIEEANQLFREGSTPGWLQDRGRIYILLGPPEGREVYPRGLSFYGEPTEIWYYGFFPIVFIDHSWSGNYKLEPLSALHISEISKAQMERKPKIARETVVFDFDLKIEKTKEGKAIIQIEVPYKNIWLVEEENKLKTTLELAIEIFDSSGKKVWEHQTHCPVSLTDKNLEETIGKDYLIKIPIHLKQGEYSLTAHLENKADENQVRKKVKFNIGKN
jgi:GWxTD domain-containing protein